MDTLLVVGVESVVGSNLAAWIAERIHVVGLSRAGRVSIAGCECEVCPCEDIETARRWIAAVRPTHVVHCGPAARSAWDDSQANALTSEGVAAARNWARAAEELGARFTLISSDALFTGPWMFHKEDSSCRCTSEQAGVVASIEQAVLQHCPDALIVRTNAYGWTPPAAGTGWIEQTLSRLEDGTAGPYDFQRYATPILATDLAAILEHAWHENLSGVYHVAGAERVNPNQFVVRLADEFDLPGPLPVDGNAIVERPQGFGRGETSLHTRKIRGALSLAMPTLADGLSRLRGQTLNGFCEKLDAEQPVLEKVA